MRHRFNDACGIQAQVTYYLCGFNIVHCILKLAVSKNSPVTFGREKITTSESYA